MGRRDIATRFGTSPIQANGNKSKLGKDRNSRVALLIAESHSIKVGESARTREIAFDNQLLAAG
jgi:hypothetical protein